MDFKFTKEQEEFRQEVRDFLEEEIRQGTFKPMCNAWSLGYSPEFSKKVAQKGWIGLSWPEKYGGQGRSHIDRFIFYEEMLRYGAPVAHHFFSDSFMSHAIIEVGSEELKRELLPKMLGGEVCFAWGQSEPDAPAFDPLAVKTQAVEDGDDFIVNGQKIWSSHAHQATHYMLFTKTDPEAPPNRRFSAFIVDMSWPGVTVRDLEFLSGDRPTFEVFLDNLRVPKKYMLGQRGYALEAFAPIWPPEWGEVNRIMGNYPLWDALIRFVKETKHNGKPLCQNPLIRSKLAQIQIEFEIGRLLVLRVADTIDKKGDVMSYKAAMVKTYAAAFQQHQMNVAMEILGLYGQLMPASQLGSILGTAGRWYLFSKCYSIRGTPSEFLRGRMAELGLGLPSSLRALTI